MKTLKIFIVRLAVWLSLVIPTAMLMHSISASWAWKFTYLVISLALLETMITSYNFVSNVKGAHAALAEGQKLPLVPSRLKLLHAQVEEMENRTLFLSAQYSKALRDEITSVVSGCSHELAVLTTQASTIRHHNRPHSRLPAA